MTQVLHSTLINRGMTMPSDYPKADYALLFLVPMSGNYFPATKGCFELDIRENKGVCDVEENGKAYAYRDSEGNYYESNFGLTFK